MVIDQFSQRVSANFEMFLGALRAVVLGRIASGAEVSPRAVSLCAQSCLDHRATFDGLASEAAFDFTQSLITEDLESDVALSLHRRMDAICSTFSVVSEAAVSTAVSAVRFGVRGPGQLLSSAHGAQGLLVQRAAGDIRFRVRDSIGRSWDAGRYLHLAARDFAYQASIDVRLANLTRGGARVGRLVSSRPDHQLAGAIVDLASPKMRELFHPNSSLWIDHV